MKRIVISTNDDPEYIFPLPLVCWAWNKFGWIPIVMTIQDQAYQNSKFSQLAGITISEVVMTGSEIIIHPGNEYRSSTWAQISRLYAAACSIVGWDDYLMTSDSDMVPLSDYWEFDPSDITIWGWDLTEYQHMPLCYLGMTKQRWIEVMCLNSNDCYSLIKRDLDSMPNARSNEFEKWWSVDQQLITDRINQVTFQKSVIKRGSGTNGYPIGRVDRSAWSLNHEHFIDAHLFRGIWKDPEALGKTILLLNKIWPDENFDWFIKYVEDFKQIINAR